MLLVIDNYDSFVHNLARYFRRLGQTTHVVRNDAVTLAQIRSWQPSALILSPGPGTPWQAGRSLELIRSLADELPVLGVCLGHQTLAAAFGGRVVRAAEPVHGRASWMTHRGDGIFAGLPSPLRVGRYHSLVVDPPSLPSELVPTALAEDGTLMALEHGELPLVGVQFHPESILTQGGLQILANFLRRTGHPIPVPLPRTDADATPQVPAEANWPHVPISF